MLVKLSKVIDTLLHVWQLRVLFSCPKNIKKRKDQSLLRALLQFSRANSTTFLSGLYSGFSMYGFSRRRFSSSCSPSSRKERNSWESY
jgi:hypothetical protein